MLFIKSRIYLCKMGNVTGTCGLFGECRETEQLYWISELTEEENRLLKDVYINMAISSK